MSRPALQRLLARPSSWEFLSLLVGCPARTRTRTGNGNGRRKASGSALALKEEELWRDSRDEVCATERCEAQPGRGSEAVRQFLSMVPPKTTFTSLRACKEVRQPTEGRRKSKSSPLQYPVQYAIPKLLLRDCEKWSKRTWSTKELEFESNLLDPDPSRLLNCEEHRLNKELWSTFLDYRQRKYGMEGVRMFWLAIRQAGIHLPTTGGAADKMWTIFLNSALQSNDGIMLEEIFEYSEEVYAALGEYWRKLYPYVLQHFLVQGAYEEAMMWHTRLDNYCSDEKLFGQLCHKVTMQSGNLDALKAICDQSRHRNVYAEVIPTLCSREDFQTALDWHFFLLEKGDLPQTRSEVEPLIRYLTQYHQRKATQLIESLHSAKVSFASQLPISFAKLTPDNSTDFLSNIHSKTFHVSEKQYNDNLGSRWLATSWIALDTAIKGIHALGVVEIGPLSLHSIALREQNAEKVVSRIEELKSLGISIGNSRFSLAVDHFARTGQQEFLDGLLHSDQHPHELEDKKLQERLLGQFARDSDWIEFRRTLEILSFRCNVPEIEKRNLMLRISLHGGAVSKIKDNLTDMRLDGIPVKNGTIFAILGAVLGHRQTGHRPTTPGGTKPPLDNSIALLQQIIRGGNHVPIKFWREIIRRLGMLGHFHALEDLCLKITTWYGPESKHTRLSRTPTQVKASNPNHPFRILFEDTLQKAIVEWGFIHTLDGRNLDRYKDLTITSGIRLLQKLGERGVYINRQVVRTAVINRLCIYYGTGESDRSYNRAARERLDMTLPEMAAIIDKETGITNFAQTDIEAVVKASSRNRLKAKVHKGRKDRVGTIRSGRYTWPEARNM